MSERDERIMRWVSKLPRPEYVDALIVAVCYLAALWTIGWLVLELTR